MAKKIKVTLTPEEKAVAQLLFKHYEGITDTELWEELTRDSNTRELFPNIQHMQTVKASLKEKGYLQRRVVNRFRFPG